MDRSGVTRVKIEPPEERSSMEEKPSKVCFNPWFVFCFLVRFWPKTGAYPDLMAACLRLRM